MCLSQSSPRCVHAIVLATLLELCDNPNTLTHILSWRDDGGRTASRLLLQLWRLEEEELGVNRDQHGVITGLQLDNYNNTKAVINVFLQLNSLFSCYPEQLVHKCQSCIWSIILLRLHRRLPHLSLIFLKCKKVFNAYNYEIETKHKDLKHSITWVVKTNELSWWF